MLKPGFLEVKHIALSVDTSAIAKHKPTKVKKEKGKGQGRAESSTTASSSALEMQTVDEKATNLNAFDDVVRLTQRAVIGADEVDSDVVERGLMLGIEFIMFKNVAFPGGEGETGETHIKALKSSRRASAGAQGALDRT